ncbi:hypothetical protein [Bacillus alkalicellulosilyticus]|uniref:hypothetical protein n=1 Tax=Alkalihalobacterium alkalicellulosilyticum TaxID=1912214 RepID=UPI00099769C6|nr:hypothetical protein [Bacillus alkalicellulosilyticus]
MTEEVVAKWNKIWVGLCLVLAGHLILSIVFIPAIFMIGLIQLAYVVPLVVICYLRKMNKLMQGALIAAGITFLVNTACFGYFVFQF